MTIFSQYARYYNLFYEKKDYVKESDYIIGIIKKYHPRTGSILDLGCGTGKHDIQFVKKGFTVTGIDISLEMLNYANKEKNKLNISDEKLIFERHDIRSFKSKKKYDTVVSLFHVFSYLTHNEDVVSALKTAKDHLKEGGLLIFDFWYGPAVLTDRPVDKTLIKKNKSYEIKRNAKPQMHPNTNIVDVNYQVSVENKTTGNIQSLRETHHMRYFFLPEMRYFLHTNGFKPVMEEELLTGKEPGFNTWGVCMAGAMT